MTAPARPSVADPKPWSFPTGTDHVLDNGMRVIVDRLPGQKVISATLVLDVPLSVEGRDNEGVATIACRCLDEGTEAHPGQTFAEALEAEGAGFGIDVTLAGLQLVLDVPASRLDRALPLFAEAVRTPTLDASDVDRHVQLRLAEIEQSRANSAQLASITFRSTMFTPESRASRMNGGEPETVSAVTAEAVRAFHRGQVDPVRMTLAIGGDFAGDPLSTVEAAFGDWPGAGPDRPAHQVAGSGPRRTMIIHRPDAVQADIRFGGRGIDRRDPRWAATTVASYAMGGAFLSRLNSVLREERGYTYGVSLAFSPMRTGGTFAVQGSFRTDVVAAALTEASALLDISGKPFTAEEVLNAQRFFTGVSPLRYATADGVVDQRATQLLADLPADYVDRNLAALRAVTPDSASQAYTEIVSVPDLTLVVVGDADALADPLRAAGFPDLEVVAQQAR